MVLYDDVTNPRWRIGFLFWPMISASINLFAPNLVQWWKIGIPRGSQCSEIGFLKIKDGGRSPSWISILARNFGVDQHFRIKFGTEMQNRQLKGNQCSKIGFSKIGRHLGFWFWAVISPSLNIITPNLVQWWRRALGLYSWRLTDLNEPAHVFHMLIIYNLI